MDHGEKMYATNKRRPSRRALVGLCLLLVTVALATSGCRRKGAGEQAGPDGAEWVGVILGSDASGPALRGAFATKPAANESAVEVAAQALDRIRRRCGDLLPDEGWLLLTSDIRDGLLEPRRSRDRRGKCAAQAIEKMSWPADAGAIKVLRLRARSSSGGR